MKRLLSTLSAGILLSMLASAANAELVLHPFKDTNGGYFDDVVLPHSIDCGASPVNTLADCINLTVIWRAEGPDRAFFLVKSYPQVVQGSFSANQVSCNTKDLLSDGQVACARIRIVYRPQSSNPSQFQGVLRIEGSVYDENGLKTEDVTLDVTLHGAVGPQYAYAWDEGAPGPCTGGSGIWITSDWTPTTGCGSVVQVRTASCAVTEGSGIRVSEARCVRQDGIPVEDRFCSGDKPESFVQSCTPTGSAACGPAPATSQVVSMNECGCVPDPANDRYCVILPF